MRNRLSTFDRVKIGSAIDDNCILCNRYIEFKLHLFFGRTFSKQIWENALLLLGHPRAASDWNFEFNWALQNMKGKSWRLFS